MTRNSKPFLTRGSHKKSVVMPWVRSLRAMCSRSWEAVTSKVLPASVGMVGEMESKGENDLPGLTNTEKPRMRGLKRESKIRKLFNLSKEDDVRKYVNTYCRTFTTKSGTKVSKAPKIQRLVTPLTLQWKHTRIAKKKRVAKAKADAAEYQKLLAQRLKAQRERRSESLAKKRSTLSAASKPSIAA
ncbi:hypothetical protein DITRI_Ditri16bG0060800 [Diplodiscus trichospermus]